MLGVVGTDPRAAGWQDVAARTGGTAVAAAPAEPSAAYDGLLAALQGRYVVRFTPSAGTRQVLLAVASGGLHLTTVLTIPGAAGAASVPAAPAPAATPAPAPAATVPDSSGVSASIPCAVLVLVGLVLITVLLLRGRRGASSSARITPSKPPEPSATSSASTEYVGRHRAPGPIVVDDDEVAADTDVVHAAPAPRRPGAHREPRHSPDWFSEAG